MDNCKSVEVCRPLIWSIHHIPFSYRALHGQPVHGLDTNALNTNALNTTGPTTHGLNNHGLKHYWSWALTPLVSTIMVLTLGLQENMQIVLRWFFLGKVKNLLLIFACARMEQPLNIKLTLIQIMCELNWPFCHICRHHHLVYNRFLGFSVSLSAHKWNIIIFQQCNSVNIIRVLTFLKKDFFSLGILRCLPLISCMISL